MQENMKEYFSEKEARERRLAIYTEKIQETVLNKSAETIRSLVDERHNQKMTQQEISDITGIKPSNLARFESGGRVPTLIVLEKYANALGKHIEIHIGVRHQCWELSVNLRTLNQFTCSLKIK